MDRNVRWRLSLLCQKFEAACSGGTYDVLASRCMPDIGYEVRRRRRRMRVRRRRREEEEEEEEEEGGEEEEEEEGGGGGGRGG